VDAWRIAEPGADTEDVVWTVDLSQAGTGVFEVLSEEEQARADRFLRAEDRDRYVASHAALRLILGRRLGLPPRDLAFEAEEGGKPRLAGSRRGACRFNLSHSGARALVGLSRRVESGVDVEALRPMPDALRVARGHFAPEEARALAEVLEAGRASVFMGLWTRKEAVVKALGTGLALPLSRFEVSLPPAPARLLASGDPRLDPFAFTLLHLEPGPGTVGAAAFAAPDARPALRALPGDWPRRLESA